MILEDALGDRGTRDANDLPAVKATLDDLFRRAAVARPDALALLDPPDRPSITDGPVRRLTYAEADRAISALAARLRGFGLPTDSVVAIQLANTVESVIALLAVMRAGLIAAPLPL
ncbi:MAG: AMP-binding protein, partial [Xanthobacteraceae bacterium]